VVIALRLTSEMGQNSEVELADADFRFTPESRHPAVGLERPFSATEQTSTYEQ
jgi:hypothetical protein